MLDLLKRTNCFQVRCNSIYLYINNLLFQSPSYLWTKHSRTSLALADIFTAPWEHTAIFKDNHTSLSVEHWNFLQLRLTPPPPSSDPHFLYAVTFHVNDGIYYDSRWLDVELRFFFPSPQEDFQLVNRICEELKGMSSRAWESNPREVVEEHMMSSWTEFRIVFQRLALSMTSLAYFQMVSIAYIFFLH